MATAATALAARTPLHEAQLAGLSGAAETLAGLGHTLLAAEVTRSLARGYRTAGLRARAELANERTTVLLERCERPRTPLLAFDETVARLTTREREIALLAATHTSKDIAANLGVAVSTVNNHLAQAYAKLGITGRHDLAVLLDPTTPDP